MAPVISVRRAPICFSSLPANSVRRPSMAPVVSVRRPSMAPVISVRRPSMAPVVSVRRPSIVPVTSVRSAPISSFRSRKSHLVARLPTTAPPKTVTMASACPESKPAASRARVAFSVSNPDWSIVRNIRFASFGCQDRKRGVAEGVRGVHSVIPSVDSPRFSRAMEWPDGTIGCRLDRTGNKGTLEPPPGRNCQLLATPWHLRAPGVARRM